MQRSELCSTGTHLPQPQVAEVRLSRRCRFLSCTRQQLTSLPTLNLIGHPQKPVEVQKTLPHALSRAAASGAVEVGPGRLSNVLKTYAVTQDKVGTARTRMDEDIRCVKRRS